MTKQLNPIVVAFDGIDGCGKTTACEAIKDKLENLHKEYLLCLNRPISVMVMHFFGHSNCSIDFRAKVRAGNISDLQIALGSLYFSTNTLRVIAKLVNDVDVILIDRSRASFFAYQIHGCGLYQLSDAFDFVLEQDNQLGHTPDYFYLRSSIERSNELIQARGIGKDYFDNKQKEFKQKIHSAYEEFFSSYRVPDKSKLTLIDLDSFESNKERNIEDFKEHITTVFLDKYLCRICDNIKEQEV